MVETSPRAFTGRRRERVTRWTVRLMDRVAKGLITIGGISTIVAVFTVLGFLVWVVYPLFQGASQHEQAAHARDWSASEPLYAALDDYSVLGLLFFRDGTVRTYRMDTGEVLEEHRLFDGRVLTAWSFPVAGTTVAFGFEDGQTQVGELGFAVDFMPPSEVPEEFHAAVPGTRLALSGAMVEKTPEGQYRRLKLSVRLDDPVPSGATNAVLLLDKIASSQGSVLCTYARDGVFRLSEVRKRKNLLTGKTTASVNTIELPSVSSPDGDAPSFLKLAGHGENVLMIWAGGHMVRVDARELSRPAVVESLSLLRDRAGAALTTVDFLLGRSTLVIGDSLGGLGGWFRVRPEQTDSLDGMRLMEAHGLPSRTSSVACVSSSARSRLVAAGYADGAMAVFHMTSGRRLVQSEPVPGDPVRLVALAPRDDAVLAVTRSGLRLWRLDAKYPEASLVALFWPVWYEGYAKAEHVWQSSGGTDDFEPKMGLIPLIFGTLKATLYSLLFGVPIALLAAVYTSEFLNPRVRMRVKPVIEIMASLPSVVLGFLAALVFAPFVEQWITSVLLVGLTVPLAFGLGARLWQLLPHKLGLRLARWRSLAIGLAFPLGLVWAMALGAPVERWLFAGDIKRWLDGQIGTATGGWLLLAFPLCSLLVAVLFVRHLNPWLRGKSMEWSHFHLALVDLFRYLAGVLVALGLALGLSAGLSLMGLDARGLYLGTYVQRNALIVGFVMGFAVIPIIYTIAEDALSTVPSHLRSASLGAGATPWQTAVRIVIPTAMSGLFSAVMIGLGRAVGETMIVLMAAGNTPIMDWNLFNGFRTLSANIAVEMPEAVRDSTHYRVLFLAALTLFVITFVINTAAELVRLRFRKRAFEL